MEMKLNTRMTYFLTFPSITQGEEVKRGNRVRIRVANRMETATVHHPTTKRKALSRVAVGATNQPQWTNLTWKGADQPGLKVCLHPGRWVQGAVQRKVVDPTPPITILLVLRPLEKRGKNSRKRRIKPKVNELWHTLHQFWNIWKFGWVNNFPNFQCFGAANYCPDFRLN